MGLHWAAAIAAAKSTGITKHLSKSCCFGAFFASLEEKNQGLGMLGGKLSANTCLTVNVKSFLIIVAFHVATLQSIRFVSRRAFFAPFLLLSL